MVGHGRERAQRTRAHARDGVLQGRRNERFERPRLEQCIDAAGAARAEVRAHRRKRRARLPELGQRVGDHRGALPALVHSARRSRALPSAAAPLRARGRAARPARASRCGASPRTRTRPPKTGGAAPHHPVSGGTQTRLLLLTGDPETNTTQTLFFFFCQRECEVIRMVRTSSTGIGRGCVYIQKKMRANLNQPAACRDTAAADSMRKRSTMNPIYKTLNNVLSERTRAHCARAPKQTKTKNWEAARRAAVRPAACAGCGAAPQAARARWRASRGRGPCRSSAMARAAPSRRCPRS